MSFFGENRTLAFVLAAVCLLIGVALVFVLFRIVFGRGIKLPGGRSRQQRLGIVDAFEIDRQRQLVIVRRDNVEHLLMIGGPNDVVVESSIIRA
ncbi:MAG: flagellar biosynthetic protein FliO, partial [Methylobacteriaceae bacterium]|nr:flagellar biosynthetic protein FliO [Methylobacteriaceae bacterium]